MYVLRTMNSLRMSFWMVPVSFSGAHALLFGRDDVERQDGQHGAVHRHRHAHLVERDAVEQDAHVEDGVDGHAGHADVAEHARMVAVVAAVRGEIEGDRQAHLAGREVAPVERVGVLGGGEARRTGGRSTAAARTWSRTGRARTARGPAACRGGRRRARSSARVQRLDGDALGRVPAFGVARGLARLAQLLVARGRGGVRFGGVEVDAREVRYVGAHQATPSCWCSEDRSANRSAPA